MVWRYSRKGRLRMINAKACFKRALQFGDLTQSRKAAKPQSARGRFQV